MNSEVILTNIRKQVKDYVLLHNIKSLVIGVSGGLDSAVNAAIVKPICDELNIPLIGLYIGIVTNKEEEKERASLIGKSFCTMFKQFELTDEFNLLSKTFDESKWDMVSESETARKIRHGNIKARMRMMLIRDETQFNKGLMIDNLNKTEYLLGFFTIADGGDISPLFNLTKTHVYELGNYLVMALQNKEQKEALQSCIDAVPTDGLGITNSDLEQLGADNYEIVDDILTTLVPIWGRMGTIEGKQFHEKRFKRAWSDLEILYGVDAVANVFNRFKHSEFKRKGLVKIDLRNVLWDSVL